MLNRPQDEPRAGDPAAPPREILLWSDDIHERHEACLLYFLRLSFGVYYDHEYIFKRLHDFYTQFDITSYCVYQILGNYDLLLRLWIPRRFIAEEIMAALREFLHGASLEEIDYIACHTRRHWADRHTRPAQTNGAQHLAPDNVGESLISAVNEFNRTQFEANQAVSRPPGTEDLMAAGMLTPISLESKGVRMFVLFDRAKRAAPDYHEDVLDRLLRACDSIEQDWHKQHPQNDNVPTGPNFSVYSGQGTMSDFLLMIRAPHGYFHEFISVVISRFWSLGLDTTYRIRPYTHVIADNLFTDFREQRVSIVSSNITTDTLKGNESDTLELKASFAVNLDAWRHNKDRKPQDGIKDHIVRSVCGFLNSLEGGTLIIGVLETERAYQKANSKGHHGDELLSWLSETFGYIIERNEDGEPRRPLQNALIGVEYEYAQGSAYADADKYYSALRDVLKDHIDPNPLRWLRVGEREVDGKRYAVVTVRPADTWCYATISTAKDPQFFVREAASTRAATGREAELYRDADPRGIGNSRREHRWP